MDNTFEYPPALSAEENITLIKEYQKTHSSQLKQHIALGNMRFVCFYISKYGSKALNCVSQGYPNYEDLIQLGYFEILKCLEKFDIDRDKKFSTYLGSALNNMLLVLIRGNKKVLLTEHYDNLFGDEKYEFDFGGMFEDKKSSPENFTNAVELEYIKTNILPYLTFKEQYVFDLHFFQGKTQDEIASIMAVHRTSICRILKIALNKVKLFYNQGVPEIDKALRGVELGSTHRRFTLCHQFVKDHGEKFLRDKYLPSLPRDQALIFEHSVLYYVGQPLPELSNDTGIPEKLLHVDLNNIDDQLANIDHHTPPNPNQKKIDITKNFIKKHGGSPFLTKYFLPTLKPNQKQAFTYGLLHYGGQSAVSTAEKCNLSVAEFKNNLSSSVEDLKTTDFKPLVLKDFIQQI